METFGKPSPWLLKSRLSKLAYRNNEPVLRELPCCRLGPGHRPGLHGAELATRLPTVDLTRDGGLQNRRNQLSLGSIQRNQDEDHLTNPCGGRREELTLRPRHFQGSVAARIRAARDQGEAWPKLQVENRSRLS